MTISGTGTWDLGNWDSRTRGHVTGCGDADEDGRTRDVRKLGLADVGCGDSRTCETNNT